MKKILLTLFLCIFAGSVLAQPRLTLSSMMSLPDSIRENPLVKNWETPHQTPPFDVIKTEHFMPAFKYDEYSRQY